MPRDLSFESEKDTLDGMQPLAPSGTNDSDGPQYKEFISSPEAADEASEPEDRLMKDMRQEKQRNELHPYTQTLNVSDVEACLELEKATFPPHEQCTREKASQSRGCWVTPISKQVPGLPPDMLATATKCIT